MDENPEEKGGGKNGISESGQSSGENEADVITGVGNVQQEPGTASGSGVVTPPPASTTSASNNDESDKATPGSPENPPPDIDPSGDGAGLVPLTIELVQNALPKLGEFNVVFVPTDNQGGRGELSTAIIDSFGVDLDFPNIEELAQSKFASRTIEGGTIVYFVVVEVGRPGEDRILRLGLSEAFANLLNTVAPAQSRANIAIWLPLMATGSGGLSPIRSLAVTLELTSVMQLGSVTLSVPAGLTSKQKTEMVATCKAVMEKNRTPVDRLFDPAARHHSGNRDRFPP